MSLSAGTRLGPYRILEKLGEGGMGEVYRARDPRLGRDVAIKVLPRQFAADADRLRRFGQEARAASALNHPNILVVHDVGTHEGAPFLVTELLEGESLRDRVRGGVLPVRQALDIAAGIVHGLAAAHAHGIVHRDLKPDNVFVTRDGRAKILDFGLAKQVAALPVNRQTELPTQDTAEATQPGLLLGTVGYVSPEQVRGEPADSRSDIFSFGCVLYEMLSGRKAFQKQTGVETLTAILKEEPPPLVPPSGSAPANLGRIVRRCLEKRPEDRFPSAHELGLALQAVAETLLTDRSEAGPPLKSIVVLPFENLSPDPENAFFADGLTEELIADLSKVSALRVISRTSAMLLRGSKKDVPTIARELNVGYVLEGSVRRAGSSLRITAQLIEAASDAHLWAEKYTGTIDDVFDMQEKVSRAIVESLKVTLTAGEKHRLAARMIPNIRAFDLYLEARQALYRLTESGLDRALQLVQEAIGVTGPNALLFSLAAEIEFFYHDQGIHTDEETLGRADSWAARALALDPGLAAGFQARGLIRGRKGDVLQEIYDLQKARELQPSGDHLGYLAWILAEVGRTAEARVYAAEMVAVDPLLWFAHWGQAWVAILDGDFEAADARTKKAAEVGGNEPVQIFFRGISSAYAGRLDAACGFFSRVVEMESTGIAMVAAALNALFSRDAEAAKGLLQDHALRSLVRLDKEFSWWLAAGCTFAGETDEALDWLANAIDLGFVNHYFFSRIDPFLARLRADSRFQALMSRARKKQAELEAHL
jgi:serine/threonine protein kinase/tetratricopeptide (TPR) repeat protein